MRPNLPVKFLGRQHFQMMPVLSLAFIQSREKFARERDLSKEPVLLSGGDRKTLAKAQDRQRSGLNVPRRIRTNQMLQAYGSMACPCPRCRHLMLIDIEPGEPIETMRCDRCRKEF